MNNETTENSGIFITRRRVLHLIKPIPTIVLSSLICNIPMNKTHVDSKNRFELLTRECITYTRFTHQTEFKCFSNLLFNWLLFLLNLPPSIRPTHPTKCLSHLSQMNVKPNLSSLKSRFCSNFIVTLVCWGAWW